MYDSVPHTRPIIVTGNTGTAQPRPGSAPPLIEQRQSRYEGPTTIMNMLSEVVTQMGMGTMSFMAHLPHYAQMEEDWAGTARMVEVLSAYYNVPSSLAPRRRGKRQYAEIDAAVEQQPELKEVIARLEAYYDSTYQSSQAASPPALSPEIERFLQGLDLGP
jgi:protein-disulfide isomerase-like protein with CxxC motif